VIQRTPEYEVFENENRHFWEVEKFYPRDSLGIWWSGQQCQNLGKSYNTMM
jgi:hypothetical protein